MNKKNKNKNTVLSKEGQEKLAELIQSQPEPTEAMKELRNRLLLEAREGLKNGKYEENGTTLYYLNSKLHRDNAPAVIFADEGTERYQYGELHRDNNPAIEDKEGNKNGINMVCYTARMGLP